MKYSTSRKSTFFVVFALIIALTLLAFFGIDNYYGDIRNVYVKGAKDIRWGIDINGGVEAVFAPDKQDVEITADDMAAAKTIIETRLVNNNITDYEVHADAQSHQIIVRFPWKADETEFDAQSAIKELGDTAMLTFCEGEDNTKIILQGAEDIKQAYVGVDPYDSTKPVVSLELTAEGTAKFATATQANIGGVISIWMDDNMLSAPTVRSTITNGQAYIDGMTSAEEAKDLADKINAGALPFELYITNTDFINYSPNISSYLPNAIIFAVAILFTVLCFITSVIVFILLIINAMKCKKLTN